MEPPSYVSIVIPCRNEEKYIEKCLHSIIDQDYPSDKIETFVCDGMSDDHTREKVQLMAAQYPGIYMLDNTERTTPQGLNLGIKRAKGDIIIILGAHAELHASYVSNCVKVLQNDLSVGCAGGILENFYENESSRVIGMAMSSTFGVGNAHFRTAAKDGYVDTVAFGAYRKEVFEKVGHFDEELVRNQDDEFNYRVTKGGYKIYLSRDIRSKYYVRASYEKLYKQYFQYGYWKVYVNKKHKAVTTIRQLIPMFFVMFLFLGLSTFLIHPAFLIPYSMGLGAYVIGAFFSALRKTRKPDQILLIMYTFFILHFSYGTGYLQGILHFMILGRKPAERSKQLSR